MPSKKSLSVLPSGGGQALIGTRSADHIMASSQSGCISRRPHPTIAESQIPLAPRAPSKQETWVIKLPYA